MQQVQVNKIPPILELPPTSENTNLYKIGRSV